MELNTYCVAHMIREKSVGIDDIEEVRDLLRAKKVVFSPPKLGNHITLIPPFRTTEKSARSLAAGLDYFDSVLLSSLSAHKKGFCALGQTFDFYRNPDVDAFIVRLKINPVIGRAVERWRKRIPEIATWVFPPASYDFNPHITIGEGRGIYRKISRLIDAEVIREGLASEMKLNLEAPRVLRKNEAHKIWEPVA